jgi:methyltransferase (TIGR00027 family)
MPSGQRARTGSWFPVPVDAERGSRTAVLVCQGRAAAHGRIAPDRFADPLAMTLLRDEERVAVQRVRDGAEPTELRGRIEYGMVSACAEIVVPRTVAIDEAIRERPVPQVVILGAGLDDRAWRMPELTDVDVFEVDHPASQRDKQSRIGDRPPRARSLRFVPVDLGRDRLDAALGPAGHRADVPTTWIWEGVVPYLRRAEVADTVTALGGLSAPGSRLVVTYQSPSMAASLGQVAVRAMAALARQRSLWADEPRRSAWTPAAMAELLATYGFHVIRNDDLLEFAHALPMTVRVSRSLKAARLAVADV